MSYSNNAKIKTQIVFPCQSKHSRISPNKRYREQLRMYAFQASNGAQKQMKGSCKRHVSV